jgi:N-acetylglucosamine-6-phosphate deacetylase
MGFHETISAHRHFDGEVLGGPVTIGIADGRIRSIVNGHRPTGAAADVTLPENVLLVPGFVDLQVNGGGGVLLNDAPGPEGAAAIAAAHRVHGTTTLLPTLITDAPEKMERLFAGAKAILALPGIAGLHLEGPYINPERSGIHPREHIQRLDQAGLAMLLAFAGRGRTMVTVAPEITGDAAIRRLAGAGVIVSLGHSQATAEEAESAFRSGAACVTHLFNAMSQMTAREPGLVGAALSSASAGAGVIADGIHVADASLRAAWRALGPQRLFLVSDAMPTVGSPAEAFVLQGRTIRLSDGRLSDEAGTLAGAHLTMHDAVRHAVDSVGLPLTDVLAMATRTPAAVLGMDGEVGCIRVGARADFCALSPEGLKGVWQGGRMVGSAPG